jgi:hypothetical protein
VQNLIIAAFALDQDLGWFHYGAQVPTPPLEHLTDDFELRHPRMPDEEIWATATRRCAALLGKIVSPLRSTANVAELARQARETALLQVGDSRELANLLNRHARQLGLDADAETGRLTTATRVATLLDQLTQETDDVVLVELLASADLGPVDDTTASRSMSSARTVASALARTQWSVLDAVAQLTDDRAEQARTLLEQLADAAAREQMHRDLIAELDKAVRLGVQLLTETRTPVAPTLVPPPTQPLPPAPVPPPAPSPPLGTGGERVVRDLADLQHAEAEIGELLENSPGKAVRVTWRVQE